MPASNSHGRPVDEAVQVQPVRRLVRSSSRGVMDAGPSSNSQEASTASPRRLRLLGQPSTNTLGGRRERADSASSSTDYHEQSVIPPLPTSSSYSFSTSPPMMPSPVMMQGASTAPTTPAVPANHGYDMSQSSTPKTSRTYTLEGATTPTGRSTANSKTDPLPKASRALPPTPLSPPPPPATSSSSSSGATRPPRTRRDNLTSSTTLSDRTRSSKSVSHQASSGSILSTSSTAAASLSNNANTSQGVSTTSSGSSSSARDVKFPTLPSAALDNALLSSKSLLLSTPYWSLTPVWGRLPNRPMRAHTATLVESRPQNSGIGIGSGASLWIFGGCDSKTCFRDMWKLDLDSHQFSKPKTRGNIHPPALRAHSCTYVPPFYSAGKTNSITLQGHLIIFGGGDGPSYFNDTYVLNLTTLTWTKPSVYGEIPAKRRAHTAVWYEAKKWLVVFGGGNGSKALNDVVVLECANWERLNWKKLEISGTKPGLRGYHTMNLIGSKAIIFGGSDGKECFSNVFILDLEALTWTEIPLYLPSLHVPRLSHSATLLSPTHLLILGGHDGTEYQSSLIVFDLSTGRFSSRPAGGNIPSGRGYHTSTYYDGRVYLLGGYDGKTHWEEMWNLDLAGWPELVMV